MMTETTWLRAVLRRAAQATAREQESAARYALAPHVCGCLRAPIPDGRGGCVKCGCDLGTKTLGPSRKEPR